MELQDTRDQELLGAPQYAETRTLSESVYVRLRLTILSGSMPPDARLNIKQIAIDYGVSLSSVREALSKLSSDGFVVAEANKGFRVAPVSRTELVDLVDTRIEIECLCIRDAVAHGDLEWQTGVVAAFHRLSQTTDFSKEDPSRPNEAWTSAHDMFHRALVSACRSPVKLRIRAALYDQTERYRRLSVAIREVDRDVHHEHRQLMDAALNRDVGLLEDHVRSHLNKTREILLESPLLAEASLNRKIRGGTRAMTP